MSIPRVVVLDYGSGNVHSAIRMLERVGANVELSADTQTVAECDGLFVPGVGNFHACAQGLRAANGDVLIAERVRASRPVFGVCVGMQIMFDTSTEQAATPLRGLSLWPGVVDRLQAPVVPHMGWSQVTSAQGSALFAGVEDERFYFVHSYALPQWPGARETARVTLAEHGAPFVAAVEEGCLMATQFHPEKSGDAGAQLMRNWLATL